MISPFVSFTVIITASNKLGITTVQELIERAKKEPGALNYGSVGVGSSQHLAGEYFAQVTGVKLTHVPYRNIAQFGPDMIAGTVPLGFAWYPNVTAPLTSNAAKALAIAGDKRLAVVPDAPTTAEAKLPAYKVDGWFGLAAPAGAEGHSRQAQQGAERGARRCRRARELREGRRGAVRHGARAVEDVSRGRDREVPRHHHQGGHRED